VLHEQLPVTAGINTLFRAPGGATPGKLIFIHSHVQLARWHVEFDDVSFLLKRKRPTDK